MPKRVRLLNPLSKQRLPWVHTKPAPPTGEKADAAIVRESVKNTGFPEARTSAAARSLFPPTNSPLWSSRRLLSEEHRLVEKWVQARRER